MMTDEIPSLPPRVEALLASLRDKIGNVLDDRDCLLFRGESPDGIVEMAREVPYRLGSFKNALEQIVR
jgi:hypothetical protein